QRKAIEHRKPMHAGSVPCGWHGACPSLGHVQPAVHAPLSTSLSPGFVQDPDAWSYQPVHHRLCLAALRLWSVRATRLSDALRNAALREALERWQDLALQRRLQLRLQSAARRLREPMAFEASHRKSRAPEDLAKLKALAAAQKSA
ncbi:unnamed protein product, partial [Effrenium voratum]